jgi:hypothetical protein
MSHTDSVYQRLRSDLAFLKLAAVALPLALETTRTENTSHTEFFEQLLAIEVDATEQRRWEGRMGFANSRPYCGVVRQQRAVAAAGDAPVRPDRHVKHATSQAAGPAA